VDFTTAKGKPNRTKLDANTVEERIREEAKGWCAKSLQRFQSKGREKFEKNSI
jgi:hypothetical protein